MLRRFSVALLCFIALGAVSSLARNKAAFEVGYPSWVSSARVNGALPTKYEDYTTNRYFLNSRQYGSYAAFASAVSASFSRASTATYTDPTATYQSAGSNVLRFDSPGGAAQGLLLEGASTNSIRNNTMQGAGGGAAPTDWQTLTGAGITPVFGTAFTSNGIAWVPVTFSGTGTSTSGQKLIGFEQSMQIAAVKTQVWVESAFLYTDGGTVPGVSLNVNERSGTGSSLLDHPVSVSVTTTPARLTTGPLTLTQASTAFVLPWLQFAVVNARSYTGTLYVGWPQAEQGAFATSPILTTNAAVTRAADALSNPWTVGGSLTRLVKIVTPPGFSGSNMVAWALDDGTTGNSFQLLYSASTGHLNLAVVSGGTAQGALDLGSVSANTAYTVAFAAQANSFRASVNGGAIVSASSGAMPSGVTTERYGAGTTGTTWFGHVEKSIFYSVFANDNALISLAASQ